MGNSWKFSCWILHFFYATDCRQHLLHNQLQVPSIANQKSLSDISHQINYPLPFWSWRNKLRPKIFNWGLCNLFLMFGEACNLFLKSVDHATIFWCLGTLQRFCWCLGSLQPKSDIWGPCKFFLMFGTLQPFSDVWESCNLFLMSGDPATFFQCLQGPQTFFFRKKVASPQI